MKKLVIKMIISRIYIKLKLTRELAQKIELLMYRVFIKYCVFSLKCWDFSELYQICCSTGVLPAWCVYTHQHRGKTGKGQSLEYFKIFGKKHNI